MAAAPSRHDALPLDAEVASLLDGAEREMRFGGASAEELTRWQGLFRERMRQGLGFPPVAGGEGAMPQVVCLEEAIESGVIRRRLRLQAGPQVAIPALLLLPEGRLRAEGQAPAALCVHPHGPLGKDLVAGQGQGWRWRRRVETTGCDYGRQLARRGVVALCPDLRGFGERAPARPSRPRNGFCYCDDSLLALQALGTPLVGLQLSDLRCCLDYLIGLAQVDPQRVGVVGHSLGGRLALYLGALDPRPAAFAVSGCMNLLRDRIREGTACASQVIPGLLPLGDTPEIYALSAPRPLWTAIGESDPLVSEQGVEALRQSLEAAYAAAGHPERLHIRRVPGGHRFPRDAAMPWLVEALEGSASTCC